MEQVSSNSFLEPLITKAKFLERHSWTVWGSDNKFTFYQLIWISETVFGEVTSGKIVLHCHKSMENQKKIEYKRNRKVNHMWYLGHCHKGV